MPGMSQRTQQEELIFKAQGLTEAIGLLSQYEDIMQGLVDAPGDRELADAFDGLSQRTVDLQSRFEPHLSTLALFGAQMSAFDARIEDKDAAPRGSDLSAVTNALANLQSELRTTHQEIERFDKWVLADRDDLLLEIAALAEALDTVRNIFRFSNSLASASTGPGASGQPDPQTEIFRQTVISLLTATIEELKAPAVNTNRLTGISRLLNRILKKSAEKKLSEAADGALDAAIRQTGKVSDLVKDLPGMDGFLS